MSQKQSKHVYSTYALLIFIFLLFVGSVVAIKAAGTNGDIQYNDDGVLSGSSNFTYDESTGTMTLTGDLLYGLLTPNLSYSATTGIFVAGANVVSNSGIALGFNPDSDNVPIYTVENDGGVLAIAGRAKNTETIAIGSRSYVTGYGAMGIGQKATAKGVESIAIGSRAQAGNVAQDVQTIAIGVDTYTEGLYSIAIGKRTQALQNYSITLGGGQNFPEYDVINNVTKSVLFGFNFGTQQNLLQAEHDKGVRIGALSGESITMDGDDLYVADNAQISGFLVVGDNTDGNLSDGDINASILYVDAVIYKSPIFLCSESANWCKIEIPEYDHPLLRVKFDDNFNPQTVVFNQVSYTPQQFNQQICQQNIQTQDICDQIITKWQKLKSQKIMQAQKRACQSQGENYFYDTSLQECMFDLQKECESKPYSLYINGICYTNPVFECNGQHNTSWSLQTDSCEYDFQKDCESQGFGYHAFSNTCFVIEKTKPLMELKTECLNNVATIWSNNECIALQDYYK